MLKLTSISTLSYCFTSTWLLLLPPLKSTYSTCCLFKNSPCYFTRLTDSKLPPQYFRGFRSVDTLLISSLSRITTAEWVSENRLQIWGSSPSDRRPVMSSREFPECRPTAFLSSKTIWVITVKVRPAFQTFLFLIPYRNNITWNKESLSFPSKDTEHQPSFPYNFPSLPLLPFYKCLEVMNIIRLYKPLYFKTLNRFPL